jgi:hypothetical protein
LEAADRGTQLDFEYDDGDSFDATVVGTTPSERKIEGIMERSTSELDFLSRTVRIPLSSKGRQNVIKSEQTGLNRVYLYLTQVRQRSLLPSIEPPCGKEI